MTTHLNAVRLMRVFLLFCLSWSTVASAGAPRRVARTRQAHAGSRHQRLLTDIVDRGSRPPLHMFETKTHFEEDKRENEQASGAAPALPPIKYWGGPVMTGNPSVNVYIIYYGSWSAGSGQPVIENFSRSLSMNSERQGGATGWKVKYWWAINEPYFQNVGGRKNVSRRVKLAGTVYDKYSAGKNFVEDTVWNVVSKKIGQGKAFAYDAQGIYLLLTSKDVLIYSYCSEYCGWHDMNDHIIGSSGVVYALVGHHGQCLEGCGGKSTSPNGNPGIDATISTIAHVIAGAATDPDARSGWKDDEDSENMDKCSYGVGATKTGRDARGNTYEYNLVGMKGMRFLVQHNWDRLKNKCVTQRR